MRHSMIWVQRGLAAGCLGLCACGPGVVDPVPPAVLSATQTALDCEGRYALPAELMGADGLGHHGFSAQDLRAFTARWGVPVAHEARWISDNENEHPSARVHVLRAPDVGQCVQDEVIAATGGDHPLHDSLRGLTPWTEDSVGLDGLGLVDAQDPMHDFSRGNAIYRALRGVAVTPAESEPLREIAATWPEAAQEPIARLILATAEARTLRDRAFRDVDEAVLVRIAEGLPQESFTTQWTANLHPRGEGMLPDLDAVAPEVERAELNASALVLARAVDEVQLALAEIEPFEGGDLQVATPGGLIRLRASGTDDTYATEDLEKVALLIDLGGDDAYTGRVASADPALPIAVVVDVRGDDTYDPGQPDLQEASTTAFTGFDAANGFTQGWAVGGVALLSDGAGQDVYRASVYSQGAAILGVGILDDRGGDDIYRAAAQGQGTAMFGLAVLRDAAGDDDYRGYTNVQGVGKPGGVGALIDGDGQDLYAALHQEQEPWLPAETSAQNFLGLPSSFPYGVDGVPHFMSIAQGTGWGFRHEWTEPLIGRSEVWGGGFGALIDLGDGNDTHVADCFSMGQGFVYGMGMLYDGGGDDTYRTFWWGPGASAHMGVGLFWEEDGNDDLYTTRASAGFGYDLGVGWMIDEGGDDVYGGQLHYGRGYLNAHTFFVNVGGDDHYNAGGIRNNPYFGVVRGGDGQSGGVRQVGAFLDLGGGQDTYETEVDGPGNGAVWHHAPVGANVNPRNHIGIGIDR